MKLYVLRHGDAAEHGDPRYKENERPLTSKGIQRTKQLAHVLREMEISLDFILSSPLTRARETAEIIARGIKDQDNMRFTEHLTPSGSMEELVHQINTVSPAPRSVMIVGHEPYLSGFVSLLCTGGPGLQMVFKKGALCRLDIEVLTCGKCAKLDWLLQPRVIGFSPPKRKDTKE